MMVESTRRIMAVEHCFATAKNKNIKWEWAYLQEPQAIAADAAHDDPGNGMKSIE